MSVYETTAYNPKIVYGGSTFLFDNTTVRINIGSPIRFTRSDRVEQFEIPATDGALILGKTRGGMQGSLTLEFATSDLQTYLTRKTALLTALEGGVESKFDLYLRYVDAYNYYCIRNCACTDIDLPDGPQDPYSPDIVEAVTGTISIVSEDYEPSIMVLGVMESGIEVAEADAVTYYGATRFLICDEFIVQNTLGEIKFHMSAVTGKLTIVGTLEQTL